MTKTISWIALAGLALATAACSPAAPPANTAANTAAAAPFAPSYAGGGAPAAGPFGAAPGTTPAPGAPAGYGAPGAEPALPAQMSPDQTAQFNAAFDKATHDSCVTSAQSNGAPAAAAETYCSCVVSKLEPLSPQDKMALQQHQDALVAAAQACKPQ
jgi:hypothetical protein